MFGLRKRTWVIGGVVAALIGSGAIAARYHNPSMEDRADFATYMIAKKLDLTDAQEASLEKLAANWVSTASSMKAFRKSMVEEVKSLASGEDLTVEQVTALRDKIKAEIDRRTDEMAPEFVAFYNGLDSDQRGKIIARLNNMSEHMEKGGMRHHRGGHMKRHMGGHQFQNDSE